MNSLTPETTAKLIQSGVIISIALGLFYGLRGRILLFAQWANLPRLAFAPVRLTLRYAILAIAGLDYQLRQNQPMPAGTK